MESILDAVWNQVTQYLSVQYILVVIFVSYLIKKNFSQLLSSITGTRWRPVYSVLLIATVIAIPFMLFTDEPWIRMLVSYSFATSLYETIFEWIENRLIKKQ
jgi:hypothetical protein